MSRRRQQGRSKSPRRRSPEKARTRSERVRSSRRESEPESWFAERFGRLRDGVIARRPMLMLTLACVLLTAVSALFISGWFGRTWHSADKALDALVADAGFGISEVHLAGNHRVSPQTVLAVLGFKPGEAIFGADLQIARRRLMKLDWVADAEVQRRYPDTISVSLVEKLPFALWQAEDGNLYVVERSGAVITSQNAGAFTNLPILIGAGAPPYAADLVEAIATHRAVSARVKAMERIAERRWNLLLDDGVVVKLPEDNWAPQLDALEHLIVDKGILERDVGEIDLRSPGNYIFILRNGDKQEVKRGKAA